MTEKTALTGNEAAALAMKHIDPDVVAAYPITPQTELMHDFAAFVANGEVSTEFVTVESEHSAMSACVGAAAAGARSMTATCGPGLALMWEILYIAASYRLPIVMATVNRALSGPINIHCDHSDSMGARDSGWIQLYCEDSQEIYDNMVQAIRISAHKDVLLPTMVCFDGFTISHTMQVLEVLTKEQVKKFIGEHKPAYTILDIKNPITVGSLDLPPYYFEHKRAQVEAMDKAVSVIKNVAEDYSKLSGRKYDFGEKYLLDDAEIVLVAMGSVCGTAKVAIKNARAKGIRAGLLKLRTFRPFPDTEIINSLKKAKLVAVQDKAISFGSGGPLFHEICSAAHRHDLNVPVVSAIYGLGGRDTTIEDLEAYIDNLAGQAKSGKVAKQTTYIALRE
ncbi:MAG: transketolase C-terminal domain-containing protein [Planctomycetota bacterium]